ncbi:MAG: DUF2167 domain-containing protein [Paludibaculum sp.]
MEKPDYAQGQEMKRYLEATGNPPMGQELAVVGPADLHWFAVIAREDRIQVEELHKAIVNGTEAANLVRSRQGRETLDVLGYREAPRFDSARQVLSWSLRIRRRAAGGQWGTGLCTFWDGTR